LIADLTGAWAYGESSDDLATLRRSTAMIAKVKLDAEERGIDWKYLYDEANARRTAGLARIAKAAGK
jgi:hypothetical protein